MGGGGSGSARPSESVQAPAKDSITELKVKSMLRLQSIIAIALVSVISIVILAYFFFAIFSLDAGAEHTDSISKIGDQLLGKLLPILTLIVGYAFGARKEEGE